jgi:hypothetical protein
MYTTAKAFQVKNNLDLTDIPSLIMHDYIHAYLGLGVSLDEETLVEYIENHLSFGLSWNTEGNRLAASLPTEFIALYN